LVFSFSSPIFNYKRPLIRHVWHGVTMFACSKRRR
jgi:hypothetical protein